MKDNYSLCLLYLNYDDYGAFVTIDIMFERPGWWSKEGIMDKNICIYQLATEFLEQIKPLDVNLDNYFLGDSRNYSSLKDIYIQFIRSAQNYQSMPNVIKFEERKDLISSFLFDYDYNQIKNLSSEDLYVSLRDAFNVGGADNNFNSWHKWSKSVVDSAKFISDFSDVNDFETFVKLFDYNVSTRMALPLLISQKISGIGFALACDLLKELGFTNYPKPDVHLIEVFSSLGLSENNAISTFEAIVRMSDCCKAEDPSATPYKIDKIFWLICSGRFYLEKPEISVGRYKKQFIEYVKRKLPEKEKYLVAEKRIDELGKIIEPYWDSEIRNVRKDAPKEIQDAYRELFDLWDDLTTV